MVQTTHHNSQVLGDLESPCRYVGMDENMQNIPTMKLLNTPTSSPLVASQHCAGECLLPAS